MFGVAEAVMILRMAIPVAGPGLDATAQQAATAMFLHHAGEVIGTSPRLLVQLPGAAPSGAVPRSQATALLASYLNDYEEVAVSVESINATSSTRGIVQLKRRYRVPGTTDVRSQAVLLSYELTGGLWLLTELRISG